MLVPMFLKIGQDESVGPGNHPSNWSGHYIKLENFGTGENWPKLLKTIFFNC